MLQLVCMVTVGMLAVNVAPTLAVVPPAKPLTTQVPVPEQPAPPDQPLKVQPDVGVPACAHSNAPEHLEFLVGALERQQPAQRRSARRPSAIQRPG
jgi:hypothetical protein